MSLQTAISTERKAGHVRLPADLFLKDDERAIMKFAAEYATEIEINEDGNIVITQEDGMDSQDVVILSPDRARMVFAVLIRLADDMDGKK